MQSKLLSKQHWLTALLCLLLLVSGLLTGIENVSAQDKPQTGVEAEPIGKLRTSIVTMTRIDPATGLPTPNPNGHAGVVVDPQGYVLTTGGCSKVGDRYRVRMSDLNEFDGKVVVHRHAERPHARARVEDERVSAREADLDAGRVAAVADRAGPRCRHRAAAAPDPDPHQASLAGVASQKTEMTPCMSPAAAKSGP